ncbi:MAG: Na+/H+ antiporter NhaC family protein [Vicinamibacteria bacterium]
MAEPGVAKPRPLDVRGGLAGALAPFALFLAGVGWLGLQGAPDERGFWPMLLAALALGLALARDRAAYAEAVLAGMSQPIVALMILAWLLAGALSTVLGASGLVESLVFLSRVGGLEGGSYVAAACCACGLVALATGTSFGTILVCAPLLYPAGGAVGADPAWLMGAILAGATFGDSLSPISDTTIASATTQGADIGGVVRARLKYALPAAVLAVVVYAALGGGGAVSGGATGPAAGPRGLPMLLVPAVVVALLLRGRHLFEGLMAGLAGALALGLSLGLLTPSQILRVDPERFGARGLIVEGLERGVGVSVFTLLLVGLVETLQRSGALGRLVERARASARSARGAELWIFATVSGAVLLTTHSVVAILAVGEFARETGERFGLSCYRRANLLDLTVCTYPFLLPYFLPTILASGASVAGVASGLPRVSPLAIGLHNAYSWAVLAVVLAAIVTGYGRNETAADSSLGGAAPHPPDAPL